MNQVIMYTSANCGYCTMAKRLLAERGIVPQELRIDTEPAAREAMTARTGRRTVPQIFIGERHVGGYDDLAQLERSGALAAML